jgi:cyclase
VVSIEAIRQGDGRYLAYTDNGREHTGVEVLEWAVRAANLGAGEILMTSVDREGTGKGYDLELTRMVSDAVSIPVIACGGAGTSEDVARVIQEGHADAVSLASLLHYEAVKRLPSGADYSAEGNTMFLRSGRKNPYVSPTTIPELKEHLLQRGIRCRGASRSGLSASGKEATC